MKISRGTNKFIDFASVYIHILESVRYSKLYNIISPLMIVIYYNTEELDDYFTNVIHIWKKRRSAISNYQNVKLVVNQDPENVEKIQLMQEAKIFMEI